MPESKQPIAHPFDPDTLGDAAVDPDDDRCSRDVCHLAPPRWPVLRITGAPAARQGQKICFSVFRIRTARLSATR